MNKTIIYYEIRIKGTSDVIDIQMTYDDALREVIDFELDDMIEDCFEKDYYEIRKIVKQYIGHGDYFSATQFLERNRK